jgi:hypothetical protein
VLRLTILEVVADPDLGGIRACTELVRVGAVEISSKTVVEILRLNDHFDGCIVGPVHCQLAPLANGCCICSPFEPEHAGKKVLGRFQHPILRLVRESAVSPCVLLCPGPAR